MRKDKPSRTAYKVAIGIVTLGAKPEMDKVLPPGIVDTTAELLVASGAVSAAMVRWARSPRMLSVYECFDWMLPGQFEALGHRKAFCEGQAREGIEDGATQVLVLGAGYDTLGWRLAPAFPAVRFFEIDHPATAVLKARGVAAMGERENLFLIAADLGERKMVDVLKGHEAWDADARTVIVAEGLVMYLPGHAVEDLFRQCASITGAGSRIAFSYIPSDTDGRPGVGKWTGLMLWLQKVIGEPWLWSIEPEALGPFLLDTGWGNGQELAGSNRKYGVECFIAARRAGQT